MPSELVPVSLGLGTNPGRDASVGGPRFTNCYAEKQEAARSPFTVWASESMKVLSTTAPASAQQLLNFDDVTMYILQGTGVHRMDAAGTVTSVGSLSSGVVSAQFSRMVRNRASTPEIGIVNNGAYYKVVSNVVSNISISSLSAQGTLVDIAYMDGFFVLIFNSGQFFVTGIDSASTLDALKFAKCESNPDGLACGVTRGRDLLLFGRNSIEVWQNTGASDFPFERVTALTMGTWFAPSVVRTFTTTGAASDTVIFAGSDQNGYSGIYMLTGYSLQKISTFDVDKDIANVTTVDSVFAFSWAENGHVFYAITGVTLEVGGSNAFTHVYDTTTGQWHQRKSNDAAVTGGVNRWRICAAAPFSNLGTIFADFAITRMYRSLTLGATSNPSSDSVLTVKASRDNGNTWHSTRTATIGGSSNKTQRFKFTRFGQSREDGMRLQLEISNAVMEGTNALSMTVEPPTINAWPNRVRIHEVRADVVPGISQTGNPKGIVGLAVGQEVDGS